MFDFQGLFKELRYGASTSGKNVIPGNVNIQCPFCTDQSNHLNCNPSKEMVFCWKCGPHSLWDLVNKIGHHPPAYYLEKYRKGKKTKTRYDSPAKETFQCKFPSVEPCLNPRAIKYLESRGYDAFGLHNRHSIFSTGPVGPWKFRVMIPVFFHGMLVSFVGRDYTGKQELRYKTASKEEEAIHHKHIFYGLDRAQNDTVMVVEGIFDAWRIGDGAVASFGTAVTSKQVNLLASLEKQVYILFDAEREAQKKARELAGALMLLGQHAEILELPEGVNDPDGLNDHEVKKLRACVWGN